MSDTVQTVPEGPFEATPKTELERQIMDPKTPKMEREWWAASEIAALRAEVERLRAALKDAAKELELLYFFAISNGIAEAGVPPHVKARAALEEKS